MREFPAGSLCVGMVMLRSIPIALDIAAKRLLLACTTLLFVKNDLDMFKSRLAVEQFEIDKVSCVLEDIQCMQTGSSQGTDCCSLIWPVFHTLWFRNIPVSTKWKATGAVRTLKYRRQGYDAGRLNKISHLPWRKKFEHTPGCSRKTSIGCALFSMIPNIMPNSSAASL